MGSQGKNIESQFSGWRTCSLINHSASSVGDTSLTEVSPPILYIHMSGIIDTCDTLWIPQGFSWFDGCVTVFGRVTYQTVIHSGCRFVITYSETLYVISHVFQFKMQSICGHWSQRPVCKVVWGRLSVSWTSLILLLKECYGSLLLLKHDPVRDPKQLTQELIKLMHSLHHCDSDVCHTYSYAYKYSLMHLYSWRV